MVSSLESPNDLRSFLDKHHVAVVDFFATWCGPCMAIKSQYAALGKKYPNIGLAQVNVEEGEELAEKYRISALPTFMCFVNGEKVRCIKGADIATVEAFIKSSASKPTSKSSGDPVRQDPKRERAAEPKKKNNKAIDKVKKS